MTVNVVFDNVKIYNVQDQLDVIVGQTFFLEIIDPPEGIEVFSFRDPVLSLTEDGLTVTTSKKGQSLLRFMVGVMTVKDVVVLVADSVGAEASALGLNFGQPETK